MSLKVDSTTLEKSSEQPNGNVPKSATNAKLSCASTIVPGDDQCASNGLSPTSPHLKEEGEEVALQDDSHSAASHSPSELYMVESKNVIAFIEGDSGNPYNWSSVSFLSCRARLSLSSGCADAK